jgi:hypothetical protein
VVARRLKFLLVVLAALLLPLSPSARGADGKGPPKDPPKGGPPEKNPPGDSKPPADPPSNSGNGKGNGPSKRVRGLYILTIAGHYVGQGEAHATTSGIKLSARVKDPEGKEYTLSARKLDVTNDRFSGTGTLGGMDVEFDGRVDPQDKRGDEVLKKGRIAFTFRVANGKHGRGAGEMRELGA